MAGGRYSRSCFVTVGAVLLLGFRLPDMDASSCQRILHKKVGDTVELSSCLPAEGVTFASWRQGNREVADDRDVIKEFRERFSLNPTNFSLTVKKLTLQDSGDYSFISEVNDKQRETVFITLQVQDPITKAPYVTVNSTWIPLNKSCLVLLECNSTYDIKVNYSWSVRNQTQSGSRLQFNIRSENEETTFTCKIFDLFSERSTSETVKCSNRTKLSSSKTEQNSLIYPLGAVGGSALFVIIVGVAVAVCHCKPKATGSDSNDLTVYADVTEVTLDGNSTMKPCSVYETIDDRIHTGSTVKPVALGPQTVYDKIQFSRGRKPSSPCQEI